jgi:pimeloyl-ACP methyl ester carboxylesterase
MTSQPKTGMAHADGAELYYERRGDGPPLLLITGGGGDAGYYTAMADHLADSYTVLSYDRRGSSRSSLLGPAAPLEMSQQSSDALAVMAASGFLSAAVFGNSGGATIVLDLAAYHPERLAAAVAHEPPVPLILPAAGEHLVPYEQIERVRQDAGWREAFVLFQTTIGGLAEQPLIVQALLDPGRFIPPGPQLDMMRRVSGNWEHMMNFEVRSFIGYYPAIEEIKAGGVPMAVAAGASTDEFNMLTSPYLAQLLDVPFAEFPGGHIAPQELPSMFADRLRPLLAELS